MEIGMMWLDDSKKRNFDEKVQRAVEYYQEKYGRQPELCLVNHRSLPDANMKVREIEIQGASNVMPHHFWIGMKS